MICSTALNSVIIQQVTSLSDIIENCSDSMDLNGDCDEIDSEECNDLFKSKSSLYIADLRHKFAHRNQQSGRTIFNLLTPPPQV